MSHLEVNQFSYHQDQFFLPFPLSPSISLHSHNPKKMPVIISHSSSILLSSFTWPSTSGHPLHSALWIPQSFVRGPSTLHNASTGLSCQKQQVSNCFATVTYGCAIQAGAWIKYIVWLQYPALNVHIFLVPPATTGSSPLCTSILFYSLVTYHPLLYVGNIYIHTMAGRFRQWPRMIPASWYSWPYVILSCWVWDRHSDLLRITVYSKSN